MHDTLMMRLRRGLQHRMEPGAQQGEGRPFRLALTLATDRASGRPRDRLRVRHQSPTKTPPPPDGEGGAGARRRVRRGHVLRAPAGPRGSPVRRQPHMAPQVAQCTNRQFVQECAVFRVFHDLRPMPSWADSVPSPPEPPSPAGKSCSGPASPSSSCSSKPQNQTGTRRTRRVRSAGPSQGMEPSGIPLRFRRRRHGFPAGRPG